MAEQEGLAALAAAEPEAATALAVKPDELAPEEQQRIAEVTASVDEVVAAAEAIQVRNAEESQAATEFLSRVAGEKRRSEAARTALVKPLNDHVRMINGQFKPKAEALATADGIVRKRVLAYEREQERIRAEEQARLDAEHRERERQAEEARRAAEAAAQAEREAAAREAAAREAEARQAREVAAKAAAKVQEELRAEMMTLPRSMVEYQAGHADEERAAAARADLERRAAEEREAAARQAAQEAAEREREAREAEQAAREAPVADVPLAQVQAAGPVRAPSGSASTTKRWTFEVTDASKVPVTFSVPKALREADEELPEVLELRPVNETAIRLLVRKGLREGLPGVRIYQDTGLSVRAR
jgi:hypothetical protein